MPVTEKELDLHLVDALKCLLSFSQEEFNLHQNTSIYFRVDFAARRKKSWSGIRKIGASRALNAESSNAPFISIACKDMFQYFNQHNTFYFQELKRINNDEKIGSFETDSWQKYANAEICHYFANLLQHVIKDPKIIKELDGPGNKHSVFWRNIYQVLREKIVNNSLDISSDSDFAIDDENKIYGFSKLSII